MRRNRRNRYLFLSQLCTCSSQLPIAGQYIAPLGPILHSALQIPTLIRYFPTELSGPLSPRLSRRTPRLTVFGNFFFFPLQISTHPRTIGDLSCRDPRVTHRLSSCLLLVHSLSILSLSRRQAPKMKTKTALAVGCLSAATAVLAQTTQCPDILTPGYNTPLVAAGWQAQLVMGGLTKPRSIEFDDTGALLVVESGKGVTRHTFVDGGGTCLTLERSDLLIDEPTVRLLSHVSSSMTNSVGHDDHVHQNMPSLP